METKQKEVYVAPEAQPLVVEAEGIVCTIGGEGALEVNCDVCYGAAIGGGFDNYTAEGTDCGTIIIEGGVLYLAGGFMCPGIGAGYSGECGDILISGGMIGGEVDSHFFYGARGDQQAAGIGCSTAGTCGDITIGPDITCLYARKGENAMKHIGLGGIGSTCGTVTVAPELDDTSENGPLDYRLIRPATPD